MNIKIDGLPMAFSESNVQEAARRVAKQFGVLVEIEKLTGAGGWPEISVIGTPQKIIQLLTSEEAWGTGDEEDDAEQVYLFLKSAVEVFG